MSIYVGIDLGTTNSAICTYDGKNTQVWKSSEQNDVTPSAIYIDRRGNTQYGLRAYNAAPMAPGNSAILFKRFMGTSTVIDFHAVNVKKTPEECSAEILKVLYGYLSGKVNVDDINGIVITVPAAFNQMQKTATMKAAELAGFRKVSLMQEPVAAVMNIMQQESSDGTFLVYDLGGGTLDIAIAESVAGKVNLITHGGIAMCGGRDFDRTLVDNVVKPWIKANFRVSDDMVQKQDSRLMRMAAWAVEKAKMELSSNENANISLSEMELNVRDLDGNEMYLDIPVTRAEYDALVEKRVMESVEATRETISKAGLRPQDISKVVFIGGPTNYKPLRDKVSFELGIPGSTDVNPMTAVAEGASIFAESIDWNSAEHSRKGNRGQMNVGSGLDVQFVYIARTSDSKTKIAAKVLSGDVSGMQFQIDSLDTGWSSGRYPLENGKIIEVNLSENGENKFKVFVFNPTGGLVNIENDSIVITRTAATIVGIPASHSIAAIVLEKVGGEKVLAYLVKAGESLPKEGRKIFRAGETLKSGSRKALTFNLVEGEIEHPVTDNRPIGYLQITGDDFDDDVIPAGAELEFNYKVMDSGNLVVSVSVPSIGATFAAKNFYTTAGKMPDFNKTSEQVNSDADELLHRISRMEEKVDDPMLIDAKEKAEEAMHLNKKAESAEDVGEAWNKIYEVKKILAKSRERNLVKMREGELEYKVRDYESYVKKYATPAENARFESLRKNALSCIGNNDNEFELILQNMGGKVFGILWQQDWFVVDTFNNMVSHPGSYTDAQKSQELVGEGKRLRDSDNISELRKVVIMLSQLSDDSSGNGDISSLVNIIRG